MLTVYLDTESIKSKGLELEECNDSYFNSIVTTDFIEGIETDYIKEIDDTEYLGNLHIKSKFTGSEKDIDCISTGCKTIYNVIYAAKEDKNKVISTIECGYNALDKIVELDEGKVYMPIIGVIDLPKTIKVIKNNKEHIISDAADLWEINEEEEEDE